MLQNQNIYVFLYQSLQAEISQKKNYMRERTLQCKASLEACKHMCNYTLQILA
jgi:hypothetical protein